MTRRLKPMQYKAALMIAEGYADPQIIKELQLRRNTLNRWRRLPEFFTQVVQHVEHVQQAARYRMGMMRYESIDALRYGVRMERDANRIKQMMALVEYYRTLPDDTSPQGTKEFAAAPNGVETAP